MQRYYLELRGVKSFWIELRLKHEHIPFESFTDSLIMTLSAIGDLITGDLTGPRSAVGNVSGYRCLSDCRSRGREFDPGPVPYFRGD